MGRHTNHHRRFGLSIAALLVLAGPLACGKGDPGATVGVVSPEEAKALLFRGVDNAAKVKTVQYSMSARASVEPSPSSSLLAGTGGCGSPVAAMAGETTTVGGIDNEAGFSYSGPRAGVVTMVAVGTGRPESATFLAARAALPPSFPGDRPWLRFDLKDLGLGSLVLGKELDPPAFAMSSGGGQQDSFDPASQLRRLRDHARSVTATDMADVDGVATRHLRLELDPERLFGGPPGSDSTTTDPALAVHGSATAEVWVDAQDRVRRLSITTTTEFPDFFAAGAAGRQGGPLGTAPEGWPERSRYEADMRFSHYDEPLPVHVPADTEIQDLGDLPASAVLATGCDPTRPAVPSSGPGVPGDAGMAYRDCVEAERREKAAGLSWRQYRDQVLRRDREALFPDASSRCQLPGFAPGDLAPTLGLDPNDPKVRECLDAFSKTFAPPAGAAPGTPGSTVVFGSPDLPPGCEQILLSGTGPLAPGTAAGSRPVESVPPELQKCADALTAAGPNITSPADLPPECLSISPPSFLPPTTTVPGR